MSELTVSTKALWLIAALTVACSPVVSGISSSAAKTGESAVGSGGRESVAPAGSLQAADSSPS